MSMTTKRLGFFSRVLDQTGPAERYRLLTEQILHAERLGFDAAWIAQHHFDSEEGGLPAPLVYLASLAARTSRIRLGTGIITLSLENALRVAEDTAVLDLLSEGRLEIGLGSGGSAAAYTAFGLESSARGAIYGEKLDLLLRAWRGDPLEGGARLYPTAPRLHERLWQATFSVAGGIRAGQAGDGLMLSRTQPKPDGATLWDVQNPIIDAYLHELPSGATPRILGSRSLFVADDRQEALRLTEIGLERAAARARSIGQHYPTGSLAELMAINDMHVGTPDEVIASLSADTALARATDLVFQVHSADPPHPYILRSIELLATRVAPALGWAPPVPARSRAAATA
ncbi:putative FMN-dependent luciferase-like monooxygenase [Teichococcus aerophilus]|nr:putative FMN-dependent luciferase-like monooxygenase [Pseudoroseomonas aerophila]